MSAPGPFVADLEAAGIRHVPLDPRHPGHGPGPRPGRGRGELYRHPARPAARHPAHPQPEAGLVRPPGRPRLARVPGRGQHGARPVRRCPATRWPEAGRRLRTRAGRGHLLAGRAGAEPRGHRRPRPPAACRRRGCTCSATASTCDRFDPAASDAEAPSIGPGAEMRRRTTRSWSAWSGGWWPRRGSPRCWPPRPRARGTDAPAPLGADRTRSIRPRPTRVDAGVAGRSAGPTTWRCSASATTSSDLYAGHGPVRAGLAPRGLPARRHGGGRHGRAGRGHRHPGLPPGGRRRRDRSARAGARRRRAGPAVAALAGRSADAGRAMGGGGAGQGRPASSTSSA